jgi:hypothetical protein
MTGELQERELALRSYRVTSLRGFMSHEKTRSIIPPPPIPSSQRSATSASIASKTA